MFKKFREKRRLKKLSKEAKEKLASQKIWSYSTWSEDLGFLNELLRKKKDDVIRFNLDIFSRQLGMDNIIQDKDIEKAIEGISTEVFNTLNQNYKDFLTSKYFSGEDQLLQYIIEDVLVELSAFSINSNFEKINKKKILELNKLITKK